MKILPKIFFCLNQNQNRQISSHSLSEPLREDETGEDVEVNVGSFSPISATESELAELNHVDIRFTRVNGENYGTPITGHAYDFLSQYILFVFVSSMLESALIGDVSINNTAVANFFTNLPTNISNTGATLLLGVAIPVAVTMAAYQGYSVYAKCKHKRFELNENNHLLYNVQTTQLAKVTNQNKFRKFFFLFLSGQIPKLLASIETDIWSTSIIKTGMAHIPGSIQFIQGGIGAIMAYCVKVERPVVIQDGASVSFKIKNEL
jgi:hypothetical protein